MRMLGAGSSITDICIELGFTFATVEKHLKRIQSTPVVTVKKNRSIPQKEANLRQQVKMATAEEPPLYNASIWKRQASHLREGPENDVEWADRILKITNRLPQVSLMVSLRISMANEELRKRGKDLIVPGRRG